MAASIARTMCLCSVAYVMPRIAARAPGHQKGASSPENAGTKTTPWQSSVSAATRSLSSLDSIARSESRSHEMPCPAVPMAPSSAYIAGASRPSLKATVEMSPCLEQTMSCPVFIRTKQPVPYVFFTWLGCSWWPSMDAC